ncbi:MAG: FAD-dependent oxidoreductase, partial [Chloroflexi bacterium]|nr:FAD-dependent oxidoreductase [Chloroflexota bacterium]
MNQQTLRLPGPYSERHVAERPRVIVVGGGLAGLAAAVAAADAGWAPLVLEKRPYLGGRAFSFVDREAGVEIDNGQHVFLGACTEYIAFLHRIGAWENVILQPRLDFPVIRNGKISNLRWSDRVPKSMGLLPSLLGYRHLSFRDKLRVAYGMLKIRGIRRSSEDAALDRETFEAWLRRNGQSEAAVRNLWNLIVLPALNDDVSVVSADSGVMLFQTALLGDSDAASIGYSRVALTRLAGDAATRYLEARGGQVRTGTEVVRVETAGSSAHAVLTTAGERISCDAVVLAVPHFGLENLLSNGLRAQEPFALASRLESAPIVGVHIWYDRPVIADVFVAVLDSPIQWVFNVDRMHSVPSPLHHVVISLSGAWEWAQMTREALREVFVPEMARVFPGAARANVERFVSVKQVQATFRSLPGTAALRPGPITPIRNLFLAGDWVATGWPSTMESAVRSGNQAARAL